VVEVTVVGDDPDAVIVDEECGWTVSWTPPFASLCRDYLLEVEEPRPTPGRAVGHIERADSHTFDSPGEQPIGVTIISSEYDGTAHPYASYVELELTVTVHG
jgi:hypothetical protein